MGKLKIMGFGAPLFLAVTTPTPHPRTSLDGSTSWPIGAGGQYKRGRSSTGHWVAGTGTGESKVGNWTWLVAWRHQANTWTNVDLSSVRSSGIHLRAISLEIPQAPFTKVSLKITYVKLNLNSPGANELMAVSISAVKLQVPCSINATREVPVHLNENVWNLIDTSLTQWHFNQIFRHFHSEEQTAPWCRCEIVPAIQFDDKSTVWGKSLTPNRSLNQWWLRPMTPNGVTRPQWVNSLLNGYGAVILKI